MDTREGCEFAGGCAIGGNGGGGDGKVALGMWEFIFIVIGVIVVVVIGGSGGGCVGSGGVGDVHRRGGLMNGGAMTSDR